jgi:hypothetical protein
MSFQQKLADITIASGTQASASMAAVHFYSDAGAIVLASPTGLAETIRVQGSWDDITFFTIEDGDGNALTLPAATQARTYYDFGGYPYLRLFSTTNVAADRTFKASKLVIV